VEITNVRRVATVRRVRIAGAAAYFPDVTHSTAEVERRIAAAGGGYRPRPGLIEAVSGIRFRHEAPAGWNASDLAVAAASKLLADQGLDVGGVDLLVFASASQDMVEPATAHIVAAKLGARCPVFDVKNACNSVLNAIQACEALIATGQYARALICTGEMPSIAIRWAVRDRAQFVQAFPGYTLSDSGGAVLLERSPDQDGDTSGIFHRAFSADSRAWDVGTLPGGGTAHPRDDEYSYFRMDGARLKDAFEGLGRGVLDEALAATGMRWEDFAVVLVHQVTAPLVAAFVRRSGVPEDKLVDTLADHGNLASATLPAQLAQAVAHGRCGPGDRIALIGLAGGVSLGVVFAEL
jgi:3-oxoacyl-[acyl-carrier-protein] synthase-3